MEGGDMIGLLLQAQWVTEASDFITQNWDKLLGVLGGTSGIIAVLTFIGKLILTCVQGKIAKKNGTPLQASFETLRAQVTLAISEFQLSLQALLNEQAEKTKEELKIYIQELLEKAQKIKVALYDKLITEGENAQDLLSKLSSKIEEAQAVFEDSKNEPEIEPKSDETQEVEQVVVEESKEQEVQAQPTTATKKVKKAKRVIME